jgi:uracil-DNA glycosylase family 4
MPSAWVSLPKGSLMASVIMRKRWSVCTSCVLHASRRQVVLGRGDLPCDLLFIGEAPGKSEDVLGKPFIGRSGKLLDTAIEAACLIVHRHKPRMYITNIVACRPCDSPQGDNRPPTPDEIYACNARLRDELHAAEPKAVVLLGKVAQKAALRLLPTATCLVHPAYILRQGGQGCPSWIKFVRDLSEVLNAI